MEQYIWEIFFELDVRMKSVKVVSSKRDLESINKTFKAALEATGFDDSDCLEIRKVEYLGEVYV